MLNSRTTRKLGWSRQLLNGHEGALMKASLFMAAALSGAGTPASARSVVGTVPAHGGHLVAISPRSEEHTSELQSLMRISYAVFCLQKKKSNEQVLDYIIYTTTHIISSQEKTVQAYKCHTIKDTL